MNHHVIGRLDLDGDQVTRARELAAAVGRPIVDLARAHTTVSVERATPGLVPT